MEISRRHFLELCRGSAAGLGFGAAYLGQLERALANPSAKTVVWLMGSGCTGCSVSVLNRIGTSTDKLPKTVAEVLIQTINLTYHPTLMSAAGESASAVAEAAYNSGNYLLAVEGAVPTAFNGATCWAWSRGGVDVTFKDAVTRLASRASAIMCVGTCASWGGVNAAPPNPTGALGVKAATLRNTLNIAGCPPHPDWVVWAIANLLTNTVGALDSYGRPLALYRRTVHDLCPRREAREAWTYGQDGYCLKEIGCSGPQTRGNCPTIRWNGGANWCVDANSQCIGCTEPTFAMSTLRSEHDDD